MHWTKRLQQPMTEMLRWFAPLCCSGCGALDVNPCQNCFNELTVISHLGCVRCHHPHVNLDTLDCEWCRRIDVFPDTIASLYSYRSLAQQFLHEAKFEAIYSHFNALLSPLPFEVWNVLPFFEFDALIPIPTTFHRRIYRMANPADLIAAQLSRITSIQVNTQLRCRHLSHQPQVGLDMNARRKNVKNRFVWHGKRPAPKGVILVDDVLTTGATMEEATKVLLQAGASRVAWFTLMRTP